MKNSKTKYIALALLINLSAGFNAAEANFFDRVKEGSKKALEVTKEASKKASEASKIALDKAKVLAETTIEYTKEQVEEIEKEIQREAQRERNKTNNNDVVVTHVETKTQVTIEEIEIQIQQDLIGESFPWASRLDSTPRVGNVTDNSLVVIEGKTKHSTRWVMLQITKDDSKQQVLIEAQDGKFISPHIGLLSGPGDYQVMIAESSDEDRYQSYSVAQTKKITNIDNRDMAFLLPSAEIQSTDPRIIELALDIAGHADSQREALTLINQWIVDNLRYDWDGFRSGSYKTDAHDALAIMEKRQAVCEGYSRLFAALARAAGIKTKFIHGKGYTGSQWAGHAWNEVYIEGKWLNVDTTWNNSMSPKKYFLIDNAEFSKNHKKEKELQY